MSPLRVAYVLKMFPRLSETFVLNEILELERQGAEVSTFSLMHPADGRFHAGVASLSGDIRYLPSQKHETIWEQIRTSPVPFQMEQWAQVIDFAERNGFPRPLEFVLRAQAIAQQVQAAGIEHIHAHFATIATRVAAAVSMLSGVPFSFTAHAKDIFRETVDRELFSELVARSAFCVTVSDYNRAFIESTMPGVDPAKIVRLYNGVDLRAIRLAADHPRTRPHVVSVGRLVPKKGFDVLLHAAARCPESDFRLTIVGDGGEREALERLRDDLGLSERVVFAGALPHDRTVDVLSMANIVALACRRDDDGNTDALPTVLLEALALGRPIVSTRLAGVPEIVGDCGLLCEPEDIDGLANALTAALDTRFDPQAARARSEQLFDLAVNVATLRERFTCGVATTSS